jgi:hypothetical protein
MRVSFMLNVIMLSAVAPPDKVSTRLEEVRTNTPAYYSKAYITTSKSFIEMIANIAIFAFSVQKFKKTKNSDIRSDARYLIFFLSELP